MKKLQLNPLGFTIIELLVFIVVITAITLVAASNIRDLRATNRDQASKMDINTISYKLEVFFEKNGYYPESIDTKNLQGLEPDNLKDRNGITINQTGSAYTFKPAGCAEARCKSFELKTMLEKEAPFIKQSLNK